MEDMNFHEDDHIAVPFKRSREENEDEYPLKTNDDQHLLSDDNWNDNLDSFEDTEDLESRLAGQQKLEQLQKLLLSSDPIRPSLRTGPSLEGIELLDIGKGFIVKLSEQRRGISAEASIDQSHEREQKSRSHEDKLVENVHGWFDTNKISTFEMRMLPEFFCDQDQFKTPHTYMEIRNYILKVWENRTAEVGKAAPRITATECRQRLAGDVGSIFRIFEFLEVYGLINCGLGSSRMYVSRFPPPTELWTPNKLKEELYQIQDEIETGQKEKWTVYQIRRLVELANAFSGDWKRVASSLGEGIDAGACLTKFMNLSPDQVLQALNTSTGGKDIMSNVDEDKAEQSISSTLKKDLYALSDPLGSILPTSLVAVKSLTARCKPQVFAAALVAAKVQLDKNAVCSKSIKQQSDLSTVESHQLANDLLELRLQRIEDREKALLEKAKVIEQSMESLACEKADESLQRIRRWIDVPSSTQEF